MTEPIQVDIREVLKQAMHQFKLEELSSWLRTHGTALFYVHDKGFTMISSGFLKEHPKLQKELDNVIKEINKKDKQPKETVEKEEEQDKSYFG